MPRWDDLGMLLAVYRAGSLAGASAALSVDASTVSRRLKAYEAALGSSLFLRTPEGLMPTELTLRLVPHAEQAEAAVLAAEAAAAGASERVGGVVRLAAAEGIAAYLLAPSVPALLDAHPALRLELIAGSKLVDLSRREADIAVRFVRPTAGDLVIKRVASSGSYGTYASEAYLDGRADLRPEALDWIGWVPEQRHLPEARLYDRLIGLPPRFAADSTVTMFEALRAGAGVALLPEAFVSLVPGLTRLPSPRADFEVGVWLVTLRPLRRVPRVDTVWRWLERLFAGDLEGVRSPA